MKNICFTILLSFALCGCLKEGKFQEDFHNTSCSENPKKDILGKWQLVSMASVWVSSPIDYSQNNIIYEFKNNNTVVISYDSKEVEYWPLPGKYSYNFEIPEYGYGIVVAGRNFYDYCISKKVMVISSVAVDGPGLYFKKL